MPRVSSDAKGSSVTLVDDHFADVARLARRESGEAVATAAGFIANHAKQAINSGPKTGRTYRRGAIVRRKRKSGDVAGLRGYTTEAGTAMVKSGSRFHRASAPGEAPAAEFNALANSILAREITDTFWQVIVQADYGAALEFGRGDGTLAPRPFMAPAAQAAIPVYVQAMARAIEAAAKEATS